MADEEAKDGAAVEFDGEAKYRGETRAKNRSNRKMTRPIYRPERRKDPTRADRPSATRPNANTKEDRPSRKPNDQDRFEKGASRPKWRSRRSSHHTRWEPVRAKRPSETEEHDSVGDREQEEPSTPILKTPAVEEQHKPEGMVGGGERSIIEEDGDAETSILCGTTTTKEEKADAEVGTTTSEGHDTGHALRPAEGQGTSVHSNEPQHDGRMKPSRGKRGTKDGVTRRQDRRREPSTIGMSGESCLGKRRRCVENEGSRTVKNKWSIPESLRDQAGRESTNRDGAVTKAAKDPNTEVGMTVRSTTREHGKQRENKERVIGSPTDRRTSAYSADNNDTRKEPTEGTHGAKRVGTRRRAGRGDGRTEGGPHATRKGRNPARIRRDRGLDRRAYAANKRRARSTTAGREGRREHRTWWIGWSRCFGNMRRIWRTGRLRWSLWKGRACSKWKTKSSKVDKGAKDSVNRHGRKSHLFPLLGTYRRMCGLVGADVVEIFVHRRKHEQREQNRGVHRCTCTHSICNILIIG